MCDYSLHGIRNRLAEEGETLVVHRFHTGSKGLTVPQNLKQFDDRKGFLAALRRLFSPQTEECAVCIPDGARLLLYGITPALQKAHGVSTSETVTFRQLSVDAGTYRDAFELKNGVTVRLQDLQEGQKVEILELSSGIAGPPERSESMHGIAWENG